MIKAVVSRASLSKVAKEMGAEAEKIRKQTQAQLADVARDGKTHAEELLKTAAYDGDPETDASIILVPESGWKWELLMAGPAAAAIEYGAGKEGIGPGKTGKEVWYFTARGRNITLRAGGRPATYKRILRSEGMTFTNKRTGAKTFEPYLEEDARRERKIRRIVGGDEAWEKGTVKTVKSQVDPNRKIRISDYKPAGDSRGTAMEIVHKEGSFRTTGNPPNSIMRRTFEHMVGEVDRIAK